MLFSYRWLKEFVPKLPAQKKVVELLQTHAFEISEVSRKDGDTIFDVDVLPNRMPDASGHRGMAREVAAVSKLKFYPEGTKRKKPRKVSLEDKNLAKDFPLSISILESESSDRYYGAIVDGVSVKSSPPWLQSRLKILGVRPVNNLVDITNLIMLKSGQPLHAFDYRKIHGHALTLRKAKKGESLQTLDGERHDLADGVLVITDRDRIIDLAGIMGGKNSEVVKSTKTIFLQVAHFNPSYIYRASRILNKKTDASIRYAAGLNHGGLEDTLHEALLLIAELAGGKVVGFLDKQNSPVVPRKILLSPEKVNRMLGVAIPEQKMITTLKRLSCQVEHLQNSPREEIVARALKLVGKPYKYGASVSKEAPRRFDCSGLVCYLYQGVGVKIPRASMDQCIWGRKIDDDELQPGDLVFSKGVNPRIRPGLSVGIGHVGVYVGDGKVVHAVSTKKKVVQESLALFKRKNYRGARRILDVLPSGHLLITVPGVRRDIELEEDLVEEIGRLFGYDNIPARRPVGELVPAEVDVNSFFKEKVRDLFCAQGFSEIKNYAFCGGLEVDVLADKERRALIGVKNPLRSEYAYLRPLLTPSMLSSIKEASKFENTLRLFEISAIHAIPLRKWRDAPDLESANASFAIFYKQGGNKKAELFFELKGTLDSLFHSIGISDIWYDDMPSSPRILKEGVGVFMHPYQFSEMKIGDKKVGMFGVLHPDLKKKFGISGAIGVGEIFFENLIQEVGSEKEYRPISKFPAIIRDIAILVPGDVRMVEVTDIIENRGGKLLVDVDLFDMYEGSGIPEGKRNLAFHLVFQSEDRTLRDSEVDKVVALIIKSLDHKSQWEVRK